MRWVNYAKLRPRYFLMGQKLHSFSRHADAHFCFTELESHPFEFRLRVNMGYHYCFGCDSATIIFKVSNMVIDISRRIRHLADGAWDPIRNQAIAKLSSELS